jgi:hypothetical protein
MEPGAGGLAAAGSLSPLIARSQSARARCEGAQSVVRDSGSAAERTLMRMLGEAPRNTRMGKTDLFPAPLSQSTHTSPTGPVPPRALATTQAHAATRHARQARQTQGPAGPHQVSAAARQEHRADRVIRLVLQGSTHCCSVSPAATAPRAARCSPLPCGWRIDESAEKSARRSEGPRRACRGCGPAGSRSANSAPRQRQSAVTRAAPPPLLTWSMHV